MNGADNLVELLLSVGVPVSETRHVVACESRLLTGDRIQCDPRIFSDDLAVLPGDLSMVGGPLSGFSSMYSARAGRTDLVLGFEFNPLILERAVIDAGIDIQSRKPLVRMVAPSLAPVLQKLDVIPFTGLWSEPLISDLSHGEHHVGMRLRRAVGSSVPVDVQVRDHPPIHELPLDKRSGQINGVIPVHFSRN